MDFLRPKDLTEALELRRGRPEAWPVAGGTIVMPKLNAKGERPAALLDLSRLRELGGWRAGDGELRIGASVTYQQLAMSVPAAGLSVLADTAGAVGSPQVRRRGTLGGAVAAAQPAGDYHPVLLAMDALIEAADADRVRDLPARRFYGPAGTTVLRPDELIVAVRLRLPSTPVHYRKVRMSGARGPAVCSLALVLDPDRRIAGVGAGGMQTPPVAAVAAERLLTAHVFGAGARIRGPVDPDFVEAFAGAVCETVPPGEPGTPAAYRRHALRVLARRALTSCWNDLTRRPGADHPHRQR